MGEDSESARRRHAPCLADRNARVRPQRASGGTMGVSATRSALARAWAASGRALASDCAEGMTKLIFEKESNRIIGGAVVGTNAGEVLGEVGLAIEMGCDAEDLALTIHAHPTLHESVGLAAEVFEGTITDLPNQKATKK